MPGHPNIGADADLEPTSWLSRAWAWLRLLLGRLTGRGAQPASPAHFLWAAAEVDQVTLTIDGVELLARLEIPNDSGTLRVQLEPCSLDEAPVAPIGRPVVMRYEGEEGAYRCESQVFLAEEPGAWWLTFPEVVETTNRRLLERLPLDPGRGGQFRLQLTGGPCPCVVDVSDISITGLRFYYRPGRIDLRRGGRTTGRLQLSEDEVMSVALEVAWVGPGRGDDFRLAGARFVALSWKDRQALQRAIFYYRRLPQLVMATDEQDFKAS